MKAYRQKHYKIPSYLATALARLLPPERLTVSEWAEKYRRLDEKSCAMPGPWRNNVTPYLIGVMDAFTDYEVEEIVFVKPTQVGGTESLQNMLGYIIAQDPAPTLIVYPSDTLAEFTSENRLQPMMRACPQLSTLWNEQTSSILELQFSGMYIALSGANSPSNLASRPIRYLLLDEVDKFPNASKREADPISLARERTKTFANRKIYMCSTPTLRTGHIWKALENADVERHYFVPCPHCAEMIELKMAQIRFPSGEGMSNTDRAEQACYVCQACGAIITDADKPLMLRHGRWQDVRRRTAGTATRVAYWMNTLYSPFVRWSQIAKEWLDAQGDDERLQNFINSWLAEPWENTRKRTDAEVVLERQTELPAYVVPSWARLLTGGVDVQENSLYWSIRAWGAYMTSQGVAHGQALSFEEIERVMNLSFARQDGGEMLVDLTLVDSGDQTEAVYDFCMKNSEWALPVKGSSREMGSHFKLSVINKVGSEAAGMQLVLVDGGKYKDMIAARMGRENGRGSWMVHADCDREYAEQITAEHKVKAANGREVWTVRRSHADNHYLDTEVYNAAAADILGVRSLFLQDEKTKASTSQTPSPPSGPEENWIKQNEGWF